MLYIGMQELWRLASKSSYDMNVVICFEQLIVKWALLYLKSSSKYNNRNEWCHCTPLV